MKGSASKYFDIVPTNVPSIYAIINRIDGTVLIQYKISSQSGTMVNMEYAFSLIEALEEYCRTVQKM